MIALMLVILAAGGCRSQKTVISPEISSSDEALFKEGEKFIKKDPEKARLYLRQVIDSFPKSFYAQRSKLAIADSYFEQGDEGSMIIAASEYREFISQFPYSPSASYAQDRIGLCFYEKALKPGRDQQKTAQALVEFRKVVTLYPLSEEAKSAREKIKDCEERLAEHLFLIGYQYYKMAAYKASTTRLSEILTTYPLYSGMEQVYFYLADSHYLWQKPEESVPYFTKLVTDYPKSKLAQKAEERLKAISAAQSAPSKTKAKK